MRRHVFIILSLVVAFAFGGGRPGHALDGQVRLEDTELVLRLDDGRVLSFDAIEFSTYYRTEGDPERTDADVRVEWVDREFDRRRLRAESPLQGAKTLDPIGRRLSTIHRPASK